MNNQEPTKEIPWKNAAKLLKKTTAANTLLQSEEAARKALRWFIKMGAETERDISEMGDDFSGIIGLDRVDKSTGMQWVRPATVIKTKEDMLADQEQMGSPIEQYRAMSTRDAFIKMEEHPNISPWLKEFARNPPGKFRIKLPKWLGGK